MGWLSSAFGPQTPVEPPFLSPRPCTCIYSIGLPDVAGTHDILEPGFSSKVHFTDDNTRTRRDKDAQAQV